MAVDLSVFGNIKTKQDYDRANEEFLLKKAAADQTLHAGALDSLTKKNNYATQILSAATASGDQSAYDQGRQQLAQQGIDVSGWAPDVQTASQQVQAARLAQSPLGTLLNAGLKGESNVTSAAGTYGSQAAGAAASPLSAAIAGQVASRFGGMNLNTPIPKPGAVQAQPLAPPPGDNGAMNIPSALPEAAMDSPGMSLPVNPAYQQAVAPTLPPQLPGETQAAYTARLSNTPSVIQAKNKAEAAGTTSGKAGVENQEAANKADELTKRLQKNLTAMLNINDDVPSSGILPGGAKAYLSQAAAANGIGTGQAAIAANQWDQINNQQVVSEIQQFLASGGAGARINQTLDRIMKAASAVNRNDLPASRKAQIMNALAELGNKNVGAQNLVAADNGQRKQPYSELPVVKANPSNIPMASVQLLRQHPDQAAAFDEKYGDGASQMILGR